MSRLFPLDWMAFANLCSRVLLVVWLGRAGEAGADDGLIDLELVLAIDCSYSVDDSEYALQRRGIAEAFRHPLLLDVIDRYISRGMAVAVVQWAGPDQQHTGLDWTIVDDETSALRLADRVAAMPRMVRDGPTAVGDAIVGSIDMIEVNEIEGARRVVDVSGDGRNNKGAEPQDLHRLIEGLSITVNGLVILNDEVGLQNYYRQKVIAGPGAFVIEALDYGDFARAMLLKLLNEIAGFALSSDTRLFEAG